MVLRVDCQLLPMAQPETKATANVRNRRIDAWSVVIS